MEQLDLVYKTFSNLERNYSRSKKTRKEYIVDKFGGDIEIGATVILDALAAGDITNPDDIAELSFVRDIFASIIANKESLDTLNSFDDLLTGTSGNVKGMLTKAFERGTGISVVTQKRLRNNGAMHYVARASGVRMIPLRFATKISVYNEVMQGFVGSSIGNVPEIGSIYKQGKSGEITGPIG